MARAANWVAAIFAAIGVSACSRSAPPAASAPSRYSAGQVWKYQTRPGEENSRVIVCRVDDSEAGRVLHIKIIGLNVKNPRAPSGKTAELPHAPISEKAFEASVIELMKEPGDSSGYEAGYEQWKAAKGGVFSISVSEIVGHIEKAINEGAS